MSFFGLAFYFLPPWVVILIFALMILALFKK